MKSKILYLHIGQTKTGSKWIQKIFSLNAQNLLASGIEYPIPAGEKAVTQTINTFDTNAQELFSSKSSVQLLLPETLKDQTHSLLLSAEMIFLNLTDSLQESPENVKKDLAYIKSLGFAEIRLLLLIRSPVERIVSQFNQFVKVGVLNEFPNVKGYKHMAENLSFSSTIALIDFLRAYPFCKLMLLNYEAVKNDLVTPLSNWLQLPVGFLAAPEVNRINRSLSYEELYLLTRIKGPARAIIPSIGFNWLYALPELTVKKMYPSVAIQEMIWELNEPYLEKINSFLPDKQKLYKTILPEFIPPDQLVFEPKQLDILIDFLTQNAQETQPATQSVTVQLLMKLKRYIKKRIFIR